MNVSKAPIRKPIIKPRSVPSIVFPSPNILFQSKKFFLKSKGLFPLATGANPLAAYAGKSIQRAFMN